MYNVLSMTCVYVMFCGVSHGIMIALATCTLDTPLLGYYLYSGTSHNGHSEIQTASIQRTGNVPSIDSAIEM